MSRLQDILVPPPQRARVVVAAASEPPVRGAWNVQVFHGLGDKGYTLNPLFLQRRRFPRVRTALNRPLSLLRLPAPFLRPPAQAGIRACRYQQLNAYGPRWLDLFAEIVRDVQVSRHGHVALNESNGLQQDSEGPIVWLPTWDNRAYLGGPNQSSLETFAPQVMQMARTVPVLVKLHPLTVRHGQAAAVRKKLARAPGITLAPADASAYRILEGARAVLTDTSSLGFEAYCSGLPVALARNPGVHHRGIHAELAERVPSFTPTEPTHGENGLVAWAHAPASASDTAWARDMLYEPSRRRNDLFAAELRERSTGPV